MGNCSNCGKQLVEGTKFCNECGAKVNSSDTQNKTDRKVMYAGEIYKCPHCGEVLNAFLTNCSSCGYELRGTRDLASKP